MKHSWNPVSYQPSLQPHHVISCLCCTIPSETEPHLERTHSLAHCTHKLKTYPFSLESKETPVKTLPFLTRFLLSFGARVSMASSPLKLLLFGLMIHIGFSVNVLAQVADEASLKLMTDTLEWPMSMSVYEDTLDENEEEDLENDEEGEFGRRSLFWRRMGYYISYGALSANRIPCPPRSGRSYYTHNCYKARGPVHPYTRPCSVITRCRK